MIRNGRNFIHTPIPCHNTHNQVGFSAFIHHITKKTMHVKRFGFLMMCFTNYTISNVPIHSFPFDFTYRVLRRVGCVWKCTFRRFAQRRVFIMVGILYFKLDFISGDRSLLIPYDPVLVIFFINSCEKICFQNYLLILIWMRHKH